MTGEILERQLDVHEAHSEARERRLEEELKRLEGIAMGHTDNVRDDVNVHNIFEGLKGGGGGNWGAIGLAGLLPLLFGRRGLGGDEGGGGAETRLQDTVNNTAILTKLGAIEASIPYNEAQVQLALAGVQNALMQQATTNANASVLATAGVKDSVTAASMVAQQNASQILQAISKSTTEIISKIDGNTIATLQAELAESRAAGRAAATEVTVTQNVNQNQAQAQAQVQLANLNSAVASLLSQNQTIHQGIVNLGTMTGNSQSSANTRVN
jgi:hypothetical protein